MTHNFKGIDFPQGGAKPEWFHDKSTPPEKRRAWFDEHNRRAALNGEGATEGCNGSPSLADEIEAAKTAHQARPNGGGTGEKPKEDEAPPGGTAEGTSDAADSAGPSEAETDAAIAALAKLPLAKFEKARKDEALRLGMRAAILDKLVAAARPQDENGMQGRAMSFP